MAIKRKLLRQMVDEMLVNNLKQQIWENIKNQTNF